MKTTGQYVFDSNSILEKAYELLCIFFANKEISRRIDPEDPGDPLRLLETRFFEPKTSRLLIEIAASFRVLSDQMYKLPAGDPQKTKFNQLLTEVDQYEFGLFDDLELTFRETCNKIIHAETFEPHFKEGHQAHEKDLAHMHGDEPKSIHWKHFSGYVRLSGKRGKVSWYVLLEPEVFISAIVKVFS